MHRLLSRQIRKHLGAEGDIPDSLKAFIEAVDQAYQQFDDDRHLMERAMEISSSELTEKNEKLKELVVLADSAKHAMGKARDEAEVANKHKSEFLANMSHEIRTPLNAIIGMSNLLIELDQTEQQRDYTEVILSSGESLLGVINDVLDFSKIEAGELDIDRHPFDLHDLVESVLDVFGFQCVEKGIDLSFYIDPAVPRDVEGDASRVRQLLINLVGNAVKFTSVGGVGMSLGCVRENDQLRLLFEIRDSGIGIPQNRIEGMFESFTQVDSSISRRFGGTGLGLAICKSLVRLMGGDISVESEIGVGSRFFFSICLPVVGEISASAMEQFSFDGVQIGCLVPDCHSIRTLEKQLLAWGASFVPTNFENLSREEIPSVLIVASENFREVSKLGLPSKLLVIDPVSGGKRTEEFVEGSEWIRSPIKPSDLGKALQQLCGNQMEVGKSSGRISTRDLLSEICPFTILIAEDNPINQKLLRLILEKEGYSGIRVVENGRMALDAMEQEAYDLVFMDMQMPELDGIGAVLELRKSVPKSEPPFVLALSANASTKDLQACLEVGMHNYLTKPIRVSALKSAMLDAYEWLLSARASSGR